ncbi:MAG: hypothetical protein SPL39_09015 [Selenomonadaceae bacterium]|nr:hypothetical protein [Selenomonadaceae bacterium]
MKYTYEFKCQVIVDYMAGRGGEAYPCVFRFRDFLERVVIGHLVSCSECM